MFKVIGIIGQLNTGKDTLSNVFTESHMFYPMAFADPLKLILQNLFDLSDFDLWGPSGSRPLIVRDMLQALGTDFARKFDPDIWVKHMMKRIETFKTDGFDHLFPSRKGFTRNSGIIATDIRFPNEAKMLVEQHKAYLIKIIRPDNFRMSTPDQAQHISEHVAASIPDSMVFRTVNNAGTLEDLRTEARRLLDIICSL
jgi:hypothetical protein